MLCASPNLAVSWLSDFSSTPLRWIMANDQRSSHAMTIPNIITIARLSLVPVVIISIVQEAWTAAFVLFLIAGVSDGIDGYIARRFDMHSEFGAVIDPLADKALIVSIFIVLAVAGQLPVWFAIIVVSRDLMILSAILVSWFMTRPVKIRPLLVSKLNTALQIGFATVLLGCKSYGIDPRGIPEILMLAIAALTVSSAGAYLIIWLRHMTGESGRASR